MKKNNKFRNNGNSNAYSLNYKFDSVSPAGKFSGTALDLIKKYNELAKEAHGAGDYIEMEVYRQYAEHYRKIVTEINERKNFRQEQQSNAQTETTQPENQEIENTEDKEKSAEATAVEPIVQTPMPMKKKAFKVVEIKENSEKLIENEKTSETQEVVKPKRVVRRKKTDNIEQKSQSEAV